MMATEKDSFSVGTLAKDATLFFNNMEDLMGASRLQHTSSMMELPSSFIHEIIKERDEEYAKYNKNDDDLKILAEEDEDEYEYEDDDDESDDKEEQNNHHRPQHVYTIPPPSTALPVWTPTTPAMDDEDTLISDSFPSVVTGRRRSGGLSGVSGLRNGLIGLNNNSNNALISQIDDDESESVSDYLSDTVSESDDKESESSADTLSLNIDEWNDNMDLNAFEECNIRFEEDEVLNSGSALQNASQFASLQFFFQFVYDRFHSYSQFLLDTSLPTYSEWKKMRKVRIRNASLKTVDYALKGCILSVDSIKCVVRNCIILCFDVNQPCKEWTFNSCLSPQIMSTRFDVGDLSIFAAFDLFDNGSSPSTNDWSLSLSLSKGIAQKLSSCLPDLNHLQNDLRESCLAFHNGKTYKFNIISEFLNINPQYLIFGDDKGIEWKLIKTLFIQKHGEKYNNNILHAFDTFSYFINPSINRINKLMNDKNDKYVSKRRIITEPIMWLYYMVSFFIHRQEKLQTLYITAMAFTSDQNNSSNKQKLNALVTNLAKQAKDESERLRAIMAKLPSKDDLKQTFIKLIKTRDPQNKTHYARSLHNYQF